MSLCQPLNTIVCVMYFLFWPNYLFSFENMTPYFLTYNLICKISLLKNNHSITYAFSLEQNENLTYCVKWFYIFSCHYQVLESSVEKDSGLGTLVRLA